MNSYLQPFPRTSFALLPSPLVRLPSIGARCGHEHLLMKKDNLCGRKYGGNKVRKLEFLLGEAKAEGRKRVITYGAAGSNHALATAVYCREVGLKAISILTPQESNAHVRNNILMQHAVGAELHLYPGYTDFPAATREIIERCTQKDGIEPYIIPTGGTNVTGALGFVNAAGEMAEQCRPDVIYIPFGTGGTLAGLLVGLKLAGLKTRVEAIRVVEPAFRNESHVKKLCDELCAKLETIAPRCDIPLVNESDIVIRNEFFGEDYGIPTPEGQDAVEMFKSLENVYLENTYTGKTAAALLHDLRAGSLEGKKVLYWNTLNSRNFSRAIADLDYRDLPTEFHSYYE